MDSHAYPGARDYLETEVAGRARHATSEEVRTTCSLARAERLIGREYHGRFLIELLQNAADASRRIDAGSGRSRIVVRITEGPALLVANEGEPMSAEVVIKSLGHIGASTKAQGQAIGHKGIGFKSVLELTLKPEIYSGLRRSVPALAVGFDPEAAIQRIRDASPNWDERAAEAQGPDGNDPLAAVPVLRFPRWIEPLPQEVAELAKDGFDTIVRLPFDSRLGDDADGWLQKVRAALGDVSDRILLLLGSFAEVIIEDRPAGTREVISPEWEQDAVPIKPGVSREIVRVLRNDELSSRWRLFRRELPDQVDLVGKIAVGIRVDDAPDVQRVLPADSKDISAPFHLFFPTFIRSGLPFLLHAYFNVNAPRTGFYRGSAEHNEAMLDGLSELVKLAVEDAVEHGSTDLASLVNLVAEAGEPDDELARRFRSDVLGRLDDVPWIPLQVGDEVPPSDRPANVFGARPGLLLRIGNAFPPSYIRRHIRLGLPDNNLSEDALQMAMARSKGFDFWEKIRELCLPGDVAPWDEQETDSRFRSLIELFVALNSENSEATRTLLDGIRGKAESQLIPTVGDKDGRVLLPVPDPSERALGRRNRLVMARVQSTEGQTLMPPDSLDVAFLPDGLLSDTERDQAKPLGVRPFTVDEVLDRLNVIEDAQIDGEALVRFLWQMLTRADRSDFGTRQAASHTSEFNPSAWFWCQPGDGRRDETTRQRQRRRRYLSAVPLPCRDGRWRKAGSIAFGSDWASWLEERAAGRPTAAASHRIAAYCAVEQLSPGPAALLASPDVVLSLLGEDVFDKDTRVSGGEEAGEAPEERHLDTERHAFLLRLGVWEVPPIEAYESQNRNRRPFPWTEQAKDPRSGMAEEVGGWKFGHGWENRPHSNVYLAEDYRFLWPLEEMAQRDNSALVASLRFGAKLYRERSNALFFCPQCSSWAGSHTVWRHSSDDAYPSTLAVQLRSEPWVPCTLDGERLDTLSKPRSAWWHPKPPSGAALRQSPLRFLLLCGPEQGVSEDLRELSMIQTLETAGVRAVERLLLELKEQYKDELLPADPLRSGSARQAFIGLHRRAYERLSELALEQPEAAAAVMDRIGVLCEVGERLEYHAPGEARHDDGRFAAYVRYFKIPGSIPFAVLARDRSPVADRLGVAKFQLELTRREEEEGRDVTDELRVIHGDRIAGLLAIMVHHSLGTQTLDVDSKEFEERARRIQNLRIRQMDDLVIDATVEGLDITVTLGKETRQDLFLESPTSSSPVLYHDLSDDGWQDLLRRKISTYLAMVLENPAYAYTFAFYLQQESDADREDFLRELGISSKEVDVIKARIGVVSEEEQRRQLRWFSSVLDLLGSRTSELSLDPEDLAARFESTHLSTEHAHRLVELGGGETARRDTDADGALWLLDRQGVDLEALDSRLRELKKNDGLEIRVYRKLFGRWMNANGRRLSAVLATALPAEEAKMKVLSLQPPDEFKFRLDPAMTDLLASVVEALRDAGLDADADGLADKPEEIFIRLGEFSNRKELDEQISRLYSEEERQRFLGRQAAKWRREIRLLAVLARTHPADTRTAIRAHDEAVTAILPPNPASPAKLRDVLETLLGEHVELADRIKECLVETVNAPDPDQGELLEWARQYGIDVDLLDEVQQTLEAPRREQSRELRKRSDQLTAARVHPIPPPGFEKITPPEPRPPVHGPIVVRKFNVTEEQVRRKKELGDEGEQWALSAVIGALMRLDDGQREAAIDEIETLLKQRFTGLVEDALAHVHDARRRDLDDEERIEALSGLLHVSQYSDTFGFDMVGWLPSSANGEPRAQYLEVKSSSGEGFHLSQGQWSLAEQLNKERKGYQYAVLVVRRGRSGRVPAAMDLLSDPVQLDNDGHLRMDVDGYRVAYRVSSS